ncbi:FecR domain-containing protein [Thiomicrorhabdus sp.]|uniref:FecR domain-containing protein n=1 Tax=Thiomicrorhabdus sp. TaxID=2039724 RepID=UPI002AA6A1EA|nr:FecR domain-containing protein [Thiomicrorhabdus sp.]
MKLFLFLSALLFSLNTFADIGTVTALKGKAFIERFNQNIAVKTGLKITEKDIIHTANKSYVQIIFNDKTTITLGSNTIFAVSAYNFSDASHSQAKFDLSNGFIKVVSGKIGKLVPNKFKIKTKTATIGIRGTVFTVLTNKSKTRLSTLKGQTYLVPLATGKVFEVPKNKQLIFDHKDRKTVIEPLSDTSYLGTKNDTSNESNETSSETDSLTDSDELFIDNIISSLTDETTKIENTNTDEAIASTKKITGSGDYSEYGYWLNEDSLTVDDVWADGTPQTSTSLIESYIGTSAKANYHGNVFAVNQNNQMTQGTINFDLDFSRGDTSVQGNFDYTVDKGGASETRWDSQFEGGVTKEGFSINTFTENPASDVTGITGNLDGTFYGPNGEEIAGTLNLSGQNQVTGETENSLGSYNAINTRPDGIQP